MIVKHRDAPANRAVWATVFALLAVYVILAWLQRVPAVTTRDDDAVYILLSREVGRLSYAQSWVIGAPIHAQYPPGFPTWLALLRIPFGETLDVFIMGNALLVAGALILIFDVLRRQWSPMMGLLFLGVAVFLPTSQEMGGHILSEALYLFLTTAVLWLATVKPTGTKWVALTMAAAVTAALTRSVGVTVIAALGTHWLLERRWRLVISLAGVTLLTVGVWQAWTLMASETFIGANYAADVLVESIGPTRTVWHRAFHTATRYWTRTMPDVFPLGTVPGTVADNIVWLVLTTTLTLMGVVSLWARWRIAVLYLLAYGGLLLLWPWILSRLLAPVLPLVVVLFLVTLGPPWSRGRLRFFTAGALALLAVGFVGGLVQRGLPQLRTRLACDRAEAVQAATCFNDDQRSFYAGSRWVAGNLPTDAKILTPKRGAFAFYARRQVLHPSLVAGHDGAEAFLARVAAADVGFIFLDRIHPQSRNRIGPLLFPVCDQLRVVAAFPPRTYLVGLRNSPDDQGPGRESGSACDALASFVENSDPDPTWPGGWW